MDNLRINDEGLMEVIPTASRDQQLDFIDTYRQLQANNNAQAASSAHALGSDLPAQYGGLHGPSDYIKSRYQTPQTESRIAALRSAAQLSALNNAMNHALNKYKRRYNNAVSADGNVKSDEIPGYGNEPSLDAAANEYSADKAPYGITRTYGQGSMNGLPLYNDTANAPDGSPSGGLLSSNGSTFHITDDMINQNAHSPVEWLWNNPVTDIWLGEDAY